MGKTAHVRFANNTFIYFILIFKYIKKIIKNSKICKKKKKICWLLLVFIIILYVNL